LRLLSCTRWSVVTRSDSRRFNAQWNIFLFFFLFRKNDARPTPTRVRHPPPPTCAQRPLSRVFETTLCLRRTVAMIPWEWHFPWVLLRGVPAGRDSAALWSARLCRPADREDARPPPTAVQRRAAAVRPFASDGVADRMSFQRPYHYTTPALSPFQCRRLSDRRTLFVCLFYSMLKWYSKSAMRRLSETNGRRKDLLTIGNCLSVVLTTRIYTSLSTKLCFIYTILFQIQKEASGFFLFFHDQYFSLGFLSEKCTVYQLDVNYLSSSTCTQKIYFKRQLLNSLIIFWPYR